MFFHQVSLICNIVFPIKKYKKKTYRLSHLYKGEIIAHSELLHEEVSPEYVRRILKGSTYSIDEETQPGEYKLHDDETIGRYDYVDKINIKSEEPGTAQFCKDLLFNTENFWSKSTFDVGRFDRKARMTLKTTTPVWDKYRPINPRKEKEAQQIIDQLEKHKLISRANSPFCAQPVWCWKKPKHVYMKSVADLRRCNFRGVILTS